MNTAVAKKGVGMLFTATKSGMSAISSGFNKARKEYGAKHESAVMAELRQKGLSPSDLLYQAFQRLYFLYLAGYKHEVVAAAQMAGKRLTDIEKSSVPLDVVTLLANSICSECTKYRDFEKSKFYQSMQDILTKSRMVKDHYDRESIVHDIYYSVLFATENHGTQWQLLEQAFRDGISHVIGTAVHVTDPKMDPREKAAKAMYIFGAEIRICSNEAETKRQRALKEAEDLLRKEKEKQSKLVSGSSGALYPNEQYLLQQR